MDQAARFVGAVGIGDGVGAVMGGQIKLHLEADFLPATPAFANGLEAVAVTGLGLP